MKELILMTIFIVLFIVTFILYIIQRKKNLELVKENIKMEDKYSTLYRRFVGYQRLEIVYGLPDNKTKRLLCEIHDAYFTSGSDKVLKHLISSIGVIKKSSVKNLPKE